MRKVVLVLFLGFYFINVNAQLIRSDKSNGLYQNDSTSYKGEVEIQLDGVTKYTDYKIISIYNDTTVVDTTLTFKKDLIFNYLRKDNFELLAFHNQGQTFNKLGYNFENNSLLPAIGANAKQFNYYKVEDISYYEVPTPTSEIFYRTGLEQGQVLDAFLTMNTSRQFNFSVAYKGLRSLGKYRNTLASHGNFRTTFNYYTENKRYYLRGHFSSFDLYNDENGGLTDASIFYFENNDVNYTDRGRLDVNFTNANNMLEGKRYYFEHSYTLLSNKLGSKAKNSSKKGPSKKRDSLARLQRLPKNKMNLKRDSLGIKNAIKTDSIAVIAQTISKDSMVMKRNAIHEIDSTKTIATIKKDSIATIAQTISKDSMVKKRNAIHEIDSTKTIATIKKDSIGMAIKSSRKDSIKLKVTRTKKLSDLKIGHTFMYETKHYRYTQTSANSIFGDAFDSSISDHTSYQKLDNQFYLQLNSPYTGTLKAKINYYKYNYHYNSILIYDAQTISDKLKGNAVVIGADWKTQFGNVYLNADASSIIVGDLTGSSIKAAAMIKKDSVYSFKGFAEFASKTPDFNKLLYQSDYLDYNWQTDFKNEEISTIGVEFTSNKWGNLKASYNLIDNYTYFDEISKPTQATETLNYLKATASKAISYKKFTLDNTIMYQNVTKGDSFFRVPELVTRNTLYYSSYVFKGKPMYLQTGVTFKYFTAFKANAYNPLLSEFRLQNTTEIGNFPVLDFFTNIQIRRTRVFLKVENLSASFTGRNYYSAPNYPYRDLTVRFGVVWNWFI